MADRIDFDHLIPKKDAGRSGEPALITFDHLIPDQDAPPLDAGAQKDRPGMEALPPETTLAERASNLGSAADNAVRAISSGIPFSDRLAAAAASATGIGGKQGDYAGNLEAERARNAGLKQANPLAYGAGNIAGAVLSMPVGGLLGKGLSLGGKVLAGGAAGAGFGALQGASEAPDLTDVGDVAKRTATSAGVGGFVGGLVPVGGAAIGAGYRAAAPFFTRPVAEATRTTGGLLANAITPRAEAALQRLGPEGLLADASPSLQGLAQGVAAKPGPAADAVIDTLTARQGGQAARLATDLDANLGPAISRSEINAAMDARQAATGPMYETALSSAPAVDITPATQALENAMLAAKGRNVGRLNDAQANLQAPYRVNGRVVPESDPRALQQAKFALDEEIARTQGQTGSSAATATRDLAGIRNALNDSLEEQLPGYANANLAWGAAERGREAYESGRTVLNGGKTALWPEELAADFNARPLEQQALMRAGARADIANQVGTNRNDLGALSRMLGDEQDFNRAKMGILFGDDATSRVIDAVNRERQFADTANRVTQGSRTAPMGIASRAIDDATAPADFTIPKNATMFGLLAHGGEWLARKGAGAIAGASNEATRNELARILTAPAPIRDQIVQGLLANQAMAAARGRTIQGVVGGVPTTRGLLGYVDDQRRGR